MKIENRPLDELIPYERNPRIISPEVIDKVANSLKEFGWQQPIVVDKDDVIVVGHVRVLAAKKLEWTDGPVHKADLTEEQIAAYRLADNRLGELADWDIGVLSDELKYVKEDTDLTDFGFREIELDMADIDELGVMTGEEEEPWADEIIRDGKPMDPDTQLSSGAKVYRLFLYFENAEDRETWVERFYKGIPDAKTRTYSRDDILAYWLPENPQAVDRD